jgi:hypothetical protein
LVGAYALDALDAGERSLVEEHLDACAACADEVVELSAVAADLAADAAEPPPISLRPAVLTQIAVTRQLPPAIRQPAQPTAVPPTANDRRSRRWTRALSVVAAALVAISAGLGAVVADQQSRIDAAQQESEILDALASAALDSPAASSVAGGGRLAVIGARDDATGVALVVARDLPELPAGKVYQLWVLGGDQAPPRPAGTLAAGAGSAGHVGSTVHTSATDSGVALTVEPGVGATKPTLPPLVSVPLQPA